MKEFKELLESGEIDFVIFTSSKSAENLVDYLGKDALKQLKKTSVCAIGPITASTLEKLGVHVACVPKDYTIEAALQEIHQILE